jgi:hypothetical protein
MFNESFFMALMFLLSGLFVWKSMDRQQPAPFLKRRLRRLGLPFAFFSLLGPLAFYPAYLQSHTHPGFWHEWLALGTWPAGPVWFIWVLLVFDLIALAVFVLVPRPFLVLSRRLGHQPPLIVFGLLLLLSALAYIPLTLHFGLYHLWIYGPFYFQTNRILYYLVYFLFGLTLGAGDEETFIQARGSLAAYWPRWVVASVGGFLAILVISFFSHRFYWHGHLRQTQWFFRSALAFAFTLSSGLTCFAFLAVFLRFVRKRRPLLDNLFACSYGIYLTHFFFVSWSQYSLLSLHFPGWLKGGLVLVVGVSGSWGLTLLARRMLPAGMEPTAHPAAPASTLKIGEIKVV